MAEIHHRASSLACWGAAYVLSGAIFLALGLVLNYVLRGNHKFNCFS